MYHLYKRIYTTCICVFRPPALASETQLHQCDGHGLGKADGCLVQLLPGRGTWEKPGNTWEHLGRSAGSWGKTCGKSGKNLEKHRKILIFGKPMGKTMAFCGCNRLMFLMHCNWGSGMCPSKLDTGKTHWKFVAAKRDKKCKRKNRQDISEQTLTTTFKPRRLPGGLFSSWKWQLKSGLKRLHLVQAANT